MSDHQRNFYDAFVLAGIEQGEHVYMAVDISLNPPRVITDRMLDNFIAALRLKGCSAATVILTDSKVQDIQTFFPNRFEHIRQMRLGWGSGTMFHDAVDDAVLLGAKHLFILGDGWAIYPPVSSTSRLAITSVNVGPLESDDPHIHGQVIEASF